MKKSIVIMLSVMMTFACGCSQKVDSQPSVQESENIEQAEISEANEAEDNTVSIGNPWVDCSEEDIQEKLDLWMFAPAESKDAQCQMNEETGLAQMTFKYGEPELEYTYRMMKAEKFEDISGLYYEWDVVDNQPIGWCDGEFKRAITDECTVDVCQWFDKDMQTMYSLSTSAADLDGFDISAIVYQLFMPEDESDVFMPANFLEANITRDTFESFDEIISLLDKGNAYAIVKVYGLDEDLLVIAEGAYDNLDGNMASIEASVYRNDNGTVRNVGNVYSNGTAYPISLDSEGRIYSGGNHEVSISAISEETGAIMSMVYAYETFDENQNVTYGGFVRENNKVYVDGVQIAEDDPSVLEKCYKEYGEATPINYTVVE